MVVDSDAAFHEENDIDLNPDETVEANLEELEELLQSQIELDRGLTVLRSFNKDLEKVDFEDIFNACSNISHLDDEIRKKFVDFTVFDLNEADKTAFYITKISTLENIVGKMQESEAVHSKELKESNDLISNLEKSSLESTVQIGLLSAKVEKLEIENNSLENALRDCKTELEVHNIFNQESNAKKSRNGAPRKSDLQDLIKSRLQAQLNESSAKLKEAAITIESNEQLLAEKEKSFIMLKEKHQKALDSKSNYCKTLIKRLDEEKSSVKMLTSQLVKSTDYLRELKNGHEEVVEESKKPLEAEIRRKDSELKQLHLKLQLQQEEFEQQQQHFKQVSEMLNKTIEENENCKKEFSRFKSKSQTGAELNARCNDLEKQLEHFKANQTSKITASDERTLESTCKQAIERRDRAEKDYRDMKRKLRDCDADYRSLRDSYEKSKKALEKMKLDERELIKANKIKDQIISDLTKQLPKTTN